MSKIGEIIRMARRENKINYKIHQKVMVVASNKNKNRFIEKLLYIRLKKIRICEECKNRFDVPLEIHHIVPISKGGNNKRKNLKVVCEKCHRKLDKK